MALRDHLEASAARGNLKARRQLDGPEFPDCLAHIWKWAIDLHGRSGIGQYGIAPLGYGTIRDWAVLAEQNPTPREVDALMKIDAALSYRPPTEGSA